MTNLIVDEGETSQPPDTGVCTCCFRTLAAENFRRRSKATGKLMRHCKDCRREKDLIRKLKAEGAEADRLMQEIRRARRDRAFIDAVDEMIRCAGGIELFAQLLVSHFDTAIRSSNPLIRQGAFSTALRFLTTADRLRADLEHRRG